MKSSLSSQILNATSVEELNNILDGCKVKIGHLGGRYIIKKGTRSGRDVSVNFIVKKLHELSINSRSTDEINDVIEKIKGLDKEGKSKLDKSRFSALKKGLTRLKQKLGSGAYDRARVLNDLSQNKLPPAPTHQARTTQPPAPPQQARTTQPPAPTHQARTTQPPAPTHQARTTQPPAPTHQARTTQPPASSAAQAAVRAPKPTVPNPSSIHATSKAESSIKSEKEFEELVENNFCKFLSQLDKTMSHETLAHGSSLTLNLNKDHQIVEITTHDDFFPTRFERPSPENEITTIVCFIYNMDQATREYHRPKPGEKTYYSRIDYQASANKQSSETAIKMMQRFEEKYEQFLRSNKQPTELQKQKINSSVRLANQFLRKELPPKKDPYPSTTTSSNPEDLLKSFSRSSTSATSTPAPTPAPSTTTSSNPEDLLKSYVRRPSTSATSTPTPAPTPAPSTTTSSNPEDLLKSYVRRPSTSATSTPTPTPAPTPSPSPSPSPSTTTSSNPEDLLKSFSRSSIKSPEFTQPAASSPTVQVSTSSKKPSQNPIQQARAEFLEQLISAYLKKITWERMQTTKGISTDKLPEDLEKKIGNMVLRGFEGIRKSIDSPNLNRTQKNDFKKRTLESLRSKNNLLDFVGHVYNPVVSGVDVRGDEVLRIFVKMLLKPSLDEFQRAIEQNHKYLQGKTPAELKEIFTKYLIVKLWKIEQTDKNFPGYKLADFKNIVTKEVKKSVRMTANTSPLLAQAAVRAPKPTVPNPSSIHATSKAENSIKSEDLLKSYVRRPSTSATSTPTPSTTTSSRPEDLLKSFSRSSTKSPEFTQPAASSPTSNPSSIHAPSKAENSIKSEEEFEELVENNFCKFLSQLDKTMSHETLAHGSSLILKLNKDHQIVEITTHDDFFPTEFERPSPENKITTIAHFIYNMDKATREYNRPTPGEKTYYSRFNSQPSETAVKMMQRFEEKYEEYLRSNKQPTELQKQKINDLGR